MGIPTESVNEDFAVDWVRIDGVEDFCGDTWVSGGCFFEDFDK